MFILHSSNKTENLLEHLAAVLKAAPLSSPFAEELFLIQSQGMERWLSQQLAQHFNVWANFRYLFPAKFFSTISESLAQNINTVHFDRHLLLWRIEAILRNCGSDDKTSVLLQNYLAGDQVHLKRYQLARQLSQIFDQYQMLRPELLAAWTQGRYCHETESELWQCAIWQKITREIGQRHRGEVWESSIQRLQQAKYGEFAKILPERISVFGVNTMPPLLLAYLEALSKHCDVHLYLLNPVQGYWVDLPGKRLQAQLAKFEGHPLLMGLGQQGREFQQMLLEQVEFQFEPSSFEAADGGGNLQTLQNDILSNSAPKRQLHPDQTLSIHSCHSRLREVQVLKDQLLAALENRPELELRDILVMAPDIQLYVPFINAVFADIQHAIADRSLRLSDPPLKALLLFLNLAQSRLGWQSVLDLLEQPQVHTSFGLYEADISLIRYWLVETQVRWGKSAAQKQALGLPALNQNTWQATLDRLFMGYAIGTDELFIDDVLPYPHIEGSASQALGGLNDFLQLLFKAADELPAPKRWSEWQMLLSRYADSLLAGIDPLARQPLNELLAEIQEISEIHQQPVHIKVVTAWLEGRMAESISSNGFLRGQLTFCSMLPMRSIPFQIIALLGMNDGEYPKIEHSPNFDLIARQSRLGDRSRRADDRYQFLEILLSARSQLIITYIGQSLRDNSEIPPSVIVSELLDIAANSYQLKELVVMHPLHPFSPRYFHNKQARLFSYAKNHYLTAQALCQENKSPAVWWQGELPLENCEAIAIDELLQFFNHPQRFFLRQQLGVSLPRLAAGAEEREPFALDSLSLYAIQQQWIDAELRGNSLTVERLQALGLWPAGAPGTVEWHRQKSGIEQFVFKLQALNLGKPKPALAVDIRVGSYRLTGKLQHLYSKGGLLYRYSNLKGKDFIAAWILHLLLNSLAAQTTYLLAKDQMLIFRPESADNKILQGLIAVFQQGKQRPDAFFTEAAFSYLQQKNPETALHNVIQQIRESMDKGYEPEIAQLFENRDFTEVFDEGFAAQCLSLLQPAWRTAHGDQGI